MLEFITRFFRRDEASSSLAKERLRLVLMSDRVSLAPETFDAMKCEMLSVLQRYLEIDEQNLDVHFENAERRFMLLANVPVVHVKSGEEIAQERAATQQHAAMRADESMPPDATTPVRRRRRRRRTVRNGAANGKANGELTQNQAEPGAAELAAPETPVEDAGIAKNGVSDHGAVQLNGSAPDSNGEDTAQASD